LIDSLDEDLNRVRRKPYVERKDSAGRADAVVADETLAGHRSRNRSIIQVSCSRARGRACGVRVAAAAGLLRASCVCAHAARVCVRAVCCCACARDAALARALSVRWSIEA
jgi:hypothetical protein